MPGESKSVGIGVGSGLVSLLCCLGPILIVLLGLGGLSIALSLSQYSPLFLALGIATMAIAIALHLRRRRKSCTCSTKDLVMMERRFLITTVSAMIVTYAALQYLIIPSLTPIVYSQASAAGSRDIGREGIRTLVLNIAGMTCSSCAYGVESALEQEPGVIDAAVSYPEGRGVVKYDPAKISSEEVVQKVVSLGFQVEVVEESAGS